MKNTIRMKAMVTWQVVALVLAVAVLIFIGYMLYFYGGDFNKFALEQSCKSKRDFHCDVLDKGIEDFYKDNPSCEFLRDKFKDLPC